MSCPHKKKLLVRDKETKIALRMVNSLEISLIVEENKSKFVFATLETKTNL